MDKILCKLTSANVEWERAEDKYIASVRRSNELLTDLSNDMGYQSPRYKAALILAGELKIVADTAYCACVEIRKELAEHRNRH